MPDVFKQDQRSIPFFHTLNSSNCYLFRQLPIIGNKCGDNVIIFQSIKMPHDVIYCLTYNISVFNRSGIIGYTMNDIMLKFDTQKIHVSGVGILYNRLPDPI